MNLAGGDYLIYKNSIAIFALLLAIKTKKMANLYYIIIF